MKISQNYKLKAALALFLLSISWAFQACFTPVVQREMSPLQQLSLQTSIAFLTLIFFNKNKQTLRVKPILFLKLNIRAIIGAVGLVLIFTGYNYAPIAHVVWVQTIPLVVIWGALLYGESIGVLQLVLLFLSLLGVAQLLGIEERNVNLGRGELTTLAGSFLFSLSLVMARPLAKQLGVFCTGAWHMILVSLFATITLLIFGRLELNISYPVLLLALGQGVLVGINNLLCTYGFLHLPSGIASSITALEVVWAPVFAYILFGEMPHKSATFGALIIFTSAMAMYLVPANLSNREA